jgi:hypothetical protein
MSSDTIRSKMQLQECSEVADARGESEERGREEGREKRKSSRKEEAGGPSQLGA